MQETSENKTMEHKKHICMGLLAHVDAGKTTLAESILYHAGSIRKMGRVDHKDAFLDTHELERARGITIFSKQAGFSLEDTEVTLLDTPGHVDFSAEMERTLQVLDYAILVISGADGVQGHVQTLWKLLEGYQLPVFLFINKMDQDGTDKARILEELKEKLNSNCLDFSALESEAFMEELAVCDEKALEAYLETGTIPLQQIQNMIQERRIFPCYFGSALKSEGIDELLSGLSAYMIPPQYGTEFGARIYKISRDEKGTRLTHMKITGGSLKVKQLVSGKDWEEKADQIRIYAGAGFQNVQEAEAGMICAVTGLTKTQAGEGLGHERAFWTPVLTPVLTYQILLPPKSDIPGMLSKLRQLEEEIPELRIVWKEQISEIHVQVMGEVQIEILKNMIQERFGVCVEFGSGSIVYKETIQEPVIGIGHFEPLRHYAEVHLLLEPGERGSGLEFATACSEDDLGGSWQRLVLTHLKEKKHIGVLAGGEITDMKLTLLAGRAHQKHTEGGDFRQATYRAVRQGLRKAQSLLLEPVYAYELEVPSEMLGRAMNDIQKMHGTFQEPQPAGAFSVLKGSAPVAAMQGYHTQVAAYTKGTGRLFCTLKGYEPSHQAEEVLQRISYDPDADLENPADSVFCAHGAGFVVPWEEVEAYAHVDHGFTQKTEEEPEEIHALPSRSFSDMQVEEKELEEIFVRTYGSLKRDRNSVQGTDAGQSWRPRKTEKPWKPKKQKAEKEYLLVDGYNIIFAWEELKELAKVNIEGARTRLMDILCNYQGYQKCILILVFDAYKVPGNPGSAEKYHNIHVVYTKEAETADQYIEKTVHEIGKQYHVTVATSDALEQVIILGQGATRMSARNLKEEVQRMKTEIRTQYLEREKKSSTYLLEHLPEDMTEFVEEVRLGRKTFE